jgi:hypothetical protein
VCGNSSVLNGPATIPPGAVEVPPGDNSREPFMQNYTAVPNVTYYFEPGVHTLGTGQYAQITGESGDTFIGAPGAVIDGQNLNDYAFTSTNTNVTIEYLTIRNFVTPFNEGAVNHDSGTGWTISHDTITNIGNTASGGQSGSAIEAGINETISWDCLSYDGQCGFAGSGVPTSVGPGAAYSNIDIEDNEFSHDAPNGDGPGEGGTSAGLKLWYNSDVTIKNNWVHDSGTVGMWADTNNNGIVIEGNYVDHNANEGLIYEISYNALIENNTFVHNAVIDGARSPDPGFPDSAIYISESGGDSRVPNGFGITSVTVSGNVFTDNWAGIVLYENADRECGVSDGSNCTLIDPSTYTSSACSANRYETSPVDYWDNCTWKTQNVTVSDNQFRFNPAHIGSTCTQANSCGFQGIFGTFSGSDHYNVPTNVTFKQGNNFTDNTYIGPWWGAVAWDQGNRVNQGSWQSSATDQCASSGELSSEACSSGFGQDRGSAFG